MLFANNAEDGSIAFFYLYIGSQTLRNSTFAASGDNMDIFVYSYASDQLNMNSFDAITDMMI